MLFFLVVPSLLLYISAELIQTEAIPIIPQERIIGITDMVFQVDANFLRLQGNCLNTYAAITNYMPPMGDGKSCLSWGRFFLFFPSRIAVKGYRLSCEYNNSNGFSTIHATKRKTMEFVCQF